MEKELLEYLNRQRNSVSACFHISRENMTNAERICVGIPDANDTLYSFFTSKNKIVRYEKMQDASGFVYTPLPPAGTGGKEAYVMLMLAEFEKLPGLSLEAKGMIMSFLPCIEWNSGRLINQRDKIPLTKDKVGKKLKLNPKTVKKIIDELVSANIIKHQNKEYFISRDFVKKGAG
jgi:hypothetical protein